MRRYPISTNDGEDVLASELDIAGALCLTLIRDNIMPRCKGSRFTSDEKKFLYYFTNGIYINISELILFELHKRIVYMRSTTCRQHTIYFFSLITSLLEIFGVKKKKRD